MEDALEQAGNEYDLLIDGVIRYGDYPFVLTIYVEGLAVSTKAMRQELGDAGFEKWLGGKKVAYNKK